MLGVKALLEPGPEFSFLARLPIVKAVCAASGIALWANGA